MSVNDDPRVIASRDRLWAIPSWRHIKRWRAALSHARLVMAVQRERARR